MNKELKNHFSLRSLFNNNKFVFAFSLLVSFFLWLWISIEKSPVVENTILSVPVEINLEDSIPDQLGLKVFGNDNYTVDVTVTGKKFVVGSLTADDIRVVAQTSYVDSSGNKTLQLKAGALNGKEFEITALSQNYISVFFDTLKEVEFVVEPKINSTVDKLVADGLILGDAVLSCNAIRVSGPATEVNRITGITAECVIDETLEKTKTFTPELKFEGADSSELTNTKMVNNSSVVTMTIPVLKEVILPTVVNLRNVPADYLVDSLNMTVSPLSVKAEIPVESLENVKEIVVGTVDFNNIKEGTNQYTFNASDITDYVIIDDKIEFNCKIVADNVDSKLLNVSLQNLIVKNADGDFNIKASDSVLKNVKLIGPKDDIDLISNENVTVSVDLSDVNITAGEMVVPVLVSLNYNTSCWVYGEYSIKILCEKA